MRDILVAIRMRACFMFAPFIYFDGFSERLCILPIFFWHLLLCVAVVLFCIFVFLFSYIFVLFALFLFFVFMLSLELCRGSSDLFLSSRPRIGLTTTYYTDTGLC